MTGFYNYVDQIQFKKTLVEIMSDKLVARKINHIELLVIGLLHCQICIQNLTAYYNLKFDLKVLLPTTTII